jgi:hypothetical protein
VLQLLRGQHCVGRETYNVGFLYVTVECPVSRLLWELSINCQVWYLENIVEEEILFLQSLVSEFLGLSWLERADLLSMYKTLVGYHLWKHVSC